MAMTKKEIQERSDLKRGVKLKSFKLHSSVIELLEQLSSKTGKSQTELVSDGVRYLAEKYGV